MLPPQPAAAEAGVAPRSAGPPPKPPRPPVSPPPTQQARQPGGGEGQGQGQPWEEEGEVVRLEFVVREAVQSVRLIMRVVQQSWQERHGSASLGNPPSPAALAPAAAAPAGQGSIARAPSPTVHHYRGPSGGGGSNSRTAGSAVASTPAPGAQDGGDSSGSAHSSSRRLSEGEVAALVAAARLMWEQLEELKGDVAKARLALLKGKLLQAMRRG